MNIQRQTSGNSQRRIGIIGRSCYTSFEKECIEIQGKRISMRLSLFSRLMKVHHDPLISADGRLKLESGMIDAEAMFQFVF